MFVAAAAYPRPRLHADAAHEQFGGFFVGKDISNVGWINVELFEESQQPEPTAEQFPHGRCVPRSRVLWPRPHFRDNLQVRLCNYSNIAQVVQCNAN